MYKSSDDLILSGTGNILSIPEIPGRNITHNQLPIIWQNYVHRPRNSREAAEKASKNTETANCLEKTRRARIFLDINVEKYTHRLIRLSLHLVLAFLL